jgi:pentatricopeptide repeat protein
MTSTSTIAFRWSRMGITIACSTRTRLLFPAVQHQRLSFSSLEEVTSPKALHKRAKQRLLEYPTEWDDQMLHQAKQTIVWSTTNGDDNASFEDNWKLWERLVVGTGAAALVDIETFHFLLNQWRKQNAFEIQSPETMMTLVQGYSSRGLFTPTENTYNMILHSLLLQPTVSRDAPEWAETILDQMMERGDLPNPSIVTFSTVLQIWVSSGHSHTLQRVQALEQRRRELEQNKDWSNLKANAVYRSTRMNAYAKAGRPHDCQALWKEWWQEYEMDQSENKIEPPNVQTATAVLMAWKRQPQRAESFLHEMIELHAKGLLEEPPNVVSYTTVLDAWAKSKTKHAPTRAEAILRHLQSRDDLAPNVVTYTSVIGAYAMQGKSAKAQALLKEMIEEGIAPNTNTFNAVLLSLSQPDQALDVLQSMTRLADAHPWDCCPDVVSYTTVLQKYAQKGDAVGAKRVWTHLIENDEVSPDIMAYNSMLNSHSKAGIPEQAQTLLEQMVQQYVDQSDEEHPSPQTASFNTVLSAWAKAGNTEKAEELFQWMQEISYKLDAARPNVITYTNLLNCWAKSKANQETVIARVESLIREMEATQDVQPNLVSYATLCKSYARFGMGSSALAVLHAMSSLNMQPNSTFYTQVAHALAENCARNPDQTSLVDQVEALIQEMLHKQIQPSVTTCSAYLKAISAARISNKAERAKHVVDWMREARVEPNDVIERQLDRILAKNPTGNP